MKAKCLHIIALLICFMSSNAYSQDAFNIPSKSELYSKYYKVENGKLLLTQVVPVEGKTKSELYRNALIWVNKTFKSPKTVIQTQDPELGLITLKSIIDQSTQYTSKWYEFTMTIQVKDGRYKYEISDINACMDMSDIGEGIVGGPVSVGSESDIHTVLQKFLPIIRSLKTQMTKEEEDW